MPENKGKHLTLEDRQVIEDGIRDGLGCREIARRLHVAPSTASREVEHDGAGRDVAVREQLLAELERVGPHAALAHDGCREGICLREIHGSVLFCENPMQYRDSERIEPGATCALPEC